MSALLRFLENVDPALTKAVSPYSDELCEVRLRAECPVVVYLLDRPFFVRASGTLTNEPSDDCIGVSFGQLRDAFARLCEFSVYKHLDNAANGFITFKGGHRVGVCGSAVVSAGKVVSVCDIKSLNIRFAKQITGCADLILSDVSVKDGLLLCGAPSSGKTTILRDLARTLSLKHMKKTAVVDERSEIASCFGGRCGFDVGLSDVYSGYPKSAAMMLAVRTMSPDIIICDELTGEDAEAVSASLGCGVSVISAVHCGSLSSARKNSSIRSLMSTGAFPKIAFLSGGIPAGLSGVYDSEVYFE